MKSKAILSSSQFPAKNFKELKKDEITQPPNGLPIQAKNPFRRRGIVLPSFYFPSWSLDNFFSL